MKYLIAFIATLTSITAFAQNQCQSLPAPIPIPCPPQCKNTSFPFNEPFKLNSKECVCAHYKFTDSTGTHPLIFCYQSNPQKNAFLGWHYKDNLKWCAMPVTLKTSSISSGEFADSEGTLGIFNNSKVTMYVVCQYAF